MKKSGVVAMCIFSLVLLSGCASMENFAAGVGETFKNTGQGAGFVVGGIGKAILGGPKAAWEGAKKADEWLRENAW